MDSRKLHDLKEAYLGIYTSQNIEEVREPGVKAYRPNPSQAEVRADAAAARRRHVNSAEGKSGYGPEEKFKSDWKLRVTPASKLKRKGGGEETVSQRMDREKPYVKRMTGPLAREYGSRTAAEVTRTVRGPGEPQAVTMPRKGTKKESFDVYDVILSHLLDEGYAESVEAAETIMVNMSEQWIEAIINN